MTLLSMSFYGAVIILAIILIRTFTLHKLPKKTFLVLWGIALLRLLVPFEITSGYSIYSLFPQESSVYVPDNPANPFQKYADSLASMESQTDFEISGSEYSIPADQSNGAIPLPVELPDTEAILLPNAESNPQTVVDNTSETSLFPGIVAADIPGDFPVLPVFWAVGTLLCTAFFLISYFRCYREFCTSLPVTEDYAAEWLALHPLRRSISIRQSDKISAPLTYGIFRPVILWPKKNDWEDTAQLDYVLYHEFTHIRRFDLVAKLVMIAALCLHWFNPFVWAMYYLFNRDIELSCDECVIKHSAETEKAAYARTLISMEEKRNFSAPLCNHFSKNAIEERIVAIMKMQKITLGAALLAVLLIVVVLVTLTTSAKSTNAAPGPLLQPLPSTTATPTPSPTPLPEPTATPLPTETPPTVTPTAAPVSPSQQRMAFPTIAAEDVYLTEKGWDLATTHEGLLPRYSELQSAGAAFETEPAQNHNIGTFHIASLDGILYFFVEPDANERDTRAFHPAITSPEYTLSGGAKVGMTLAELLALYPDLAKTELNYEDPFFEAWYGPTPFHFRDDQFPQSFLKNYDFALVANIQKQPDTLPVCLAFLVKNNEVGAITVYMPTAG